MKYEGFRLRGLGKKCCVCSVLTPRLSSDGGRAHQNRDLSLSWVEVRSALVQPFLSKILGSHLLRNRLYKTISV